MTREEARQSAEVMLAYADGKEIEFNLKHKNIWYTHDGDTVSDGEKIIHTLEFDFTKFDYRIKPEPTYRPFKDKKECWTEMQKHQPFGWVCYDKRFINIDNIDDIGTVYQYESDLYSLDYTDSLKYMKFADGTPFGIKEG